MQRLTLISNQRLIILSILVGLVMVLGYQFLKSRPHDKVQAVGALTFTFNGLPPSAPVFSVDDLKPGDCYLRPVTVQNDGAAPASISVRSENINNPDNLSSILYITITEGVNTLYGGLVDPKTLAQFFTDSTATLEGLFLSIVGPHANTTYQFNVCMPKEAGNEWQKTTLVFDLLFGSVAKPTVTPTPGGTTPTPTPTLPPECQALAGTIQHVFYGTENGDSIHGSVDNDLIIGLGGNDLLDASGGDDCVVGGAGNDQIRTEDGNDIIIGGLGDDGLKSGSGNDVVYGNEGNDLIDSGTGADVVYAGLGDDYVTAGDQDDQVWGGDGNDRLDGDGGNDHLYGDAGVDILNGGSGDDQLSGDLGNDTLNGNSGNDTLDGGPDTDSLTGSTGTDTCVNGETVVSCEF